MSLKDFLVQPFILPSYYRRERDGLVSENGTDCKSETLNSHFGLPQAHSVASVQSLPLSHSQSLTKSRVRLNDV